MLLRVSASEAHWDAPAAVAGSPTARPACDKRRERLAFRPLPCADESSPPDVASASSPPSGSSSTESSGGRVRRLGRREDEERPAEPIHGPEAAAAAPRARASAETLPAIPALLRRREEDFRAAGESAAVRGGGGRCCFWRMRSRLPLQHMHARIVRQQTAKRTAMTMPAMAPGPRAAEEAPDEAAATAAGDADGDGVPPTAGATRASDPLMTGAAAATDGPPTAASCRDREWALRRAGKERASSAGTHRVRIRREQPPRRRLRREGRDQRRPAVGRVHGIHGHRHGYSGR